MVVKRRGNLSKSIHLKDKFKIVGFYPRRPKINLSSHKIIIKINNKLIESAKEASRINIPMIAGCPLVRNLWKLNEQADCIWIKLTDKTNAFYEIEYNDEILPEYKVLQNDEVLNSNDDILNFIINVSKQLYFENFIQAIRSIRTHNLTHNFMGFGSYKAVYFLLKDEK